MAIMITSTRRCAEVARVFFPRRAFQAIGVAVIARARSLRRWAAVKAWQDQHIEHDRLGENELTILPAQVHTLGQSVKVVDRWERSFLSSAGTGRVEDLRSTSA